jgi:hypothetical protein
MPSRREYLAALGASTVLAGCLGNGDGTPTASDSPAETSREPTTTPTAEPTAQLPAVGGTISVDGVDLTLERVRCTGSLPYVYTDSGDVQTNPEGRYVLAKVTTPSSSPPAASRYSLVAAGGRAYAIGSAGSFWLGPDGDRDPYRPGPGSDVGDSSGGWLAFPVDAELDADAPRVAVGTTGWRLPDRVVARFRQPAARYELRELAHPETVTPDEAFTVSVAVENVGPVSGTFRAVLNTSIRYASSARPVFLDLDPGERRTWELDFGPDEGLNEVGEVGRLDLRTPSGDRNGEIEVVAGTAVGTATER